MIYIVLAYLRKRRMPVIVAHNINIEQFTAFVGHFRNGVLENICSAAAGRANHSRMSMISWTVVATFVKHGLQFRNILYDGLVDILEIYGAILMNSDIPESTNGFSWNLRHGVEITLCE